MDYRRHFTYWLPVIAGMTFIYWMSTEAFSAANTSRIIDPLIRFFVPSISRKNLVMVHAVVRKTAHVVEYLVLGLLLFRAFRAGSLDRRWWRWAGLSFWVVVLYALTDEFHQLHVPVRTGSLVDVGFDAFGGLLAQGISIHYYRRQRKRSISTQDGKG